MGNFFIPLAASTLEDWLIPSMVVIVVLALLALVRIVSNNYIKVPPNRVAIFYGRKRRMADGKIVGFRVVTGGAKFKFPIVESVAFLDLNMFSIDLSVQGAPNKDGVLVNVRGVANVKILSDEISLMTACERFLGMDTTQIKDIAFKNLEGHLRAIIGRLTVEEIVSDRTKFNQEVLKEAGEDLRKIGLGVDILTIQEIEDQYGYIKALGQKRTAEVMRDATVGRAAAERDAMIGKTDSERDATVRATTAKREAEQKANENLALIAEAEKLRDVKKAMYFAEVQREQATASQAGPLAEAEAKKRVIEQQVEVLRIQTVKEGEVAVAEAEKQQKSLLATVVRPAEAEREAAIARADGERVATIKRAEAERQKLELEGQGEGAAIRAKGQAEADIIRLKVLAQGEAEANVIRMKLLAEAEGIEKKAEAFRKLDEAGRTLQILEVVRHIVPECLEKLAPVMGEIAKPLGNVDRISIVDFGGGAPGSSTGLTRFAQTAPLILTQLFEGLKAAGIDPTDLAKLLRLKLASGPGDALPVHPPVKPEA